MRIDMKDGKPVLTLTATEKHTLANASGLLANISRAFDGEEATKIKTLSNGVAAVYDSLTKE